MLSGHHVLTVLSLLPLSLALLLPSPHDLAPSLSSLRPRRLDLPDSRQGDSGRWFPKRKSKGPAKRDVLRPPLLGAGARHGGLALEVIERGPNERSEADMGVEKRSGAGNVNGTVIPLGSALNTYVLPLALGSPPQSYPLQLDLASSDLLLATTLCGTTDACPASSSSNPYYDAAQFSPTFQELNGNASAWRAGFGDGTTASGLVGRERVYVGSEMLDGQVFGMINSTNLTLSEQQISGILGLGFPRLSILARALLHSAESTATPSSAASGSPSITTSAAVSTSSNTSTYLPTLLESLVTTPHIPYPVFALALSPPPGNSSQTGSSSSASVSATPSARYGLKTGSLTLGGVSSLYISNDTASGRRIEDIEWHDVMPFGRMVGPFNETAKQAIAAETDSMTSSTTSTVNANVSATSEVLNKRQEVTSGGVPSTLRELDEEQYLYWALPLANVSVNGTDLGLQPTYEVLGLPSVALLDAGSNGIYGPQQDVARLFGMIQDAREVSEGRWVVPCDSEIALGFSFGGRYVQLQPSDWMYAQVSGSSFCLAWPVAIPSTGDGIDWQLGTPFLTKVYSIFSYGINNEQAPLVGFLPIADSTTSPALSPSAVPSLITSAASSSIISTTSALSVNPAAPTTIQPLSPTTTVTTMLPNALLPSPTFATPSYIFEQDTGSLTPGVLQATGLANATAYTVGPVSVVTSGNGSTTGNGGGVSGNLGNGQVGGAGGSQGGTSGAGTVCGIEGMVGVVSVCAVAVAVAVGEVLSRC